MIGTVKMGQFGHDLDHFHMTGTVKWDSLDVIGIVLI